jgi:membrane fusion protein (multidrug efflux system)
MKLKILSALFLVALILGALGGVKYLQIQKMIAGAKTMLPPPETVSSVEVRADTWKESLTAIGTINAVQGVTMTPDVPGTVREIAFESGAVVAKDALLVRLDTSSEDAQLRAVEAQAELARLNLARMRTLKNDNTVSQSDLDTAEATLKQAQANGDNIRATIAKKTIRAPFAGQLGIRLINLGQYLETGKPIVSLQALSPVYADFSLPQQELAKLKTGMRVELVTDAYPEKRFVGALTAINPDLDQATRSVGLQATLENPGHLLRPGMFARVEVLLPGEHQVLVIPATSVLSAPYGDSVYVIEPHAATTNQPAGLAVRQQFVRTGRTRGDYISVQSGLKAGERIVGAGLFKLRNGMPVVENNTLAPKSATEPRPSDS